VNEHTLTSRPSSPVKIRHWEAGGLHAHVTYPDGSWLRRTWNAGSWWEIDALIRQTEEDYGKANVLVTG